MNLDKVYDLANCWNKHLVLFLYALGKGHATLPILLLCTNLSLACVCVCVCVCVLVCSCREDLVMAARIHKVAGEITKTKLLVAGIGLTEYDLVPLVLDGM